MASQPWPPSTEHVSRKRPYSSPDSPTRNIRMRNAVHEDVLFEQGIYPTYASFSARGSRAISCFRDGFARVWNVDPVHPRFLDCEQVIRHGETVYRAAISDDGARAITTAGDGVARIWELTKPDCPSREIGSHYRSTRSCDVSSDGKYVAVTFYTGKKAPLSKFQGKVVLYDPDQDVELFRRSVSGVPDKVCVSRDGNVVAVGCYGVTPAKIMARDTRLTLFDRTGECRYFFPKCFPDEDACVAWDLSDDGRYVAICAQNRSVIELYSELAPKQWVSAPRILCAAVPLIYEKVRIVDNGDLVTALALDKSTKERSILVFRPSSGNVLFSLACGLKDPKACVDLEPRVCYVAATYERAERKVVRLLSRTGGEGASLNLVRCGDPPKNAFHGTTTKAISAVPSASMDILSPSARSGNAEVTTSPPAPRLLNGSPTPKWPQPSSVSPERPQVTNVFLATPQLTNISPARPQPLDASPAPANTDPVRSKILPSDDQFVLDKRNDGDTTMAVDAYNKAPTAKQVSPTLSTSNLSNDTSPMQRIAELPIQESTVKETNDINQQTAQSVQRTSGSTSDVVTKTLQTSQDANHVPEYEPTTPGSKSNSDELLRAEMEKLSCNSTLATKSALPNTSPLVNTTVMVIAKESSSTERDQTLEPKEDNDPVQHSSNQVMDRQERGLTNEAADLNNPKSQSNPPIIVDENNGVESKKTDSTNPQSTDPNLQMKQVPTAPTSNLKKPRWQRMINKQPLGNRGGRREANDILTTEGKGNQNLGDFCSRTKSEDIADGDTSRVNGILNKSPSAQPCEESPVAPGQGSATSPGVQRAINLTTLPCDKATKAQASPANAVGVNPSLHGSKTPSMSPSSITENEAKAEEALLMYPNVGSSPQSLPMASCTETKEVKTTYEVKQEASHVYKNRYFIALEAAKTLFHQASHTAGGEQVVSNVKGFKTMLEFLRAENELINRKTVARIVYAKGGIRDAINEASFLEAFSVLYGEVQAVRQRVWSDVYDQAGAEEEGLLLFHARDLITRECAKLSVQLNPTWNNETLDEVIASYSTDGVLVERNAFVQAADHIFSI